MKRFIVAILLSGAMAFGQDRAVRHIDFTEALISLDGTAMKVDGGTEKLTLGTVAVNSLLATLEGDKNLAGTEKVKRYELAKKVFHQSSVVLTAEEISLIKQRIADAYGPLVVGVAWHLLDPQP